MTYRDVIGRRVARLLMIGSCLAVAGLALVLALLLVAAVVAPESTALLSDKPLLD